MALKEIPHVHLRRMCAFVFQMVSSIALYGICLRQLLISKPSDYCSCIPGDLYTSYMGEPTGTPTATRDGESTTDAGASSTITRG
jgi:hypothetical protein